MVRKPQRATVTWPLYGHSVQSSDGAPLRATYMRCSRSWLWFVARWVETAAAESACLHVTAPV